MIDIEEKIEKLKRIESLSIERVFMHFRENTSKFKIDEITICKRTDGSKIWFEYTKEIRRQDKSISELAENMDLTNALQKENAELKEKLVMATNILSSAITSGKELPSSAGWIVLRNRCKIALENIGGIR